jgi:signal transduction histidine kinase
MPDESLTVYITAGIYWALILCWGAILYFYIREYRWLRRLSPLVATLVLVIIVDAARTLVESVYFGAWYTARTSVIPYSLYTTLQQPQWVLIPKLLNLVAALLIIAVMVRRWFRDAAEEMTRHEDLKCAHAELTELEALRDDLVHMVVHDMRSPLTSVVGSLQTALDGDLDSEIGHEMVENAFVDAQRLVAMTQSLLDVSRLERGQLPVNRREADIVGVVSQAVRTAAHLAREKGVHIVIDSPAEAPLVAIDTDLMVRVLTNLLQNAARHTPEGGIVTVSAHVRRGAAGHAVVLAVADTGEGISKEIRERIFDKFFHAARHTDRAGAASTGLGLAFCRLAVEAHGGTISVDSQVGQGSTFCIELPLPEQPSRAASDGPRAREARPLVQEVPVQ